MLTHPGTPCIFYDDLWTDGDKLRELIALRKRVDVTCRSNVEILCADADMYVARIDDKCAGPACLWLEALPATAVRIACCQPPAASGATNLSIPQAWQLSSLTLDPTQHARLVGGQSAASPLLGPTLAKLPSLVKGSARAVRQVDREAGPALRHGGLASERGRGLEGRRVRQGLLRLGEGQRGGAQRGEREQVDHVRRSGGYVPRVGKHRC